MSRYSLFQAAAAADAAWMREIAHVFGANGAGRARAQGNAAGEPGSLLRDLYDQSVVTRRAYQACRAGA